VIELDATNRRAPRRARGNIREHLDGLDGIVHCIAFGPQDASRQLPAHALGVGRHGVHVSATR